MFLVASDVPNVFSCPQEIVVSPLSFEILGAEIHLLRHGCKKKNRGLQKVQRNFLRRGKVLFAVHRSINDGKLRLRKPIPVGTGD